MNNISIDTELDQIITSIDFLKIAVKKINEKFDKMDERIIVLENKINENLKKLPKKCELKSLILLISKVHDLENKLKLYDERKVKDEIAKEAYCKRLNFF